MVISHGSVRSRQDVKNETRLENTRWELVELNGNPIAAPMGQPEPHLRLISEGRSLQGYGGCNTMRGGYELAGEKLRFTQIGTTRMTCPDPFMNQEGEFLRALESADSFKIIGNQLELYGSGAALARFEGRPSD
jgi:heat shock protein HslJ